MGAAVTALMEFYEEHDKEVDNDGVMSELRKHGQWEDERIESDDDPRERGGSFCLHSNITAVRRQGVSDTNLVSIVNHKLGFYLHVIQLSIWSVLVADDFCL